MSRTRREYPNHNITCYGRKYFRQYHGRSVEVAKHQGYNDALCDAGYTPRPRDVAMLNRLPWMWDDITYAALDEIPNCS